MRNIKGPRLSIQTDRQADTPATGNTPNHLDDIEQSFWLNRSVARAIGVNLSDALAKGHLSPDDYSVMVTRCHAQGCHAACQRWLAAQTGERPKQPPEYCANAEVLAWLRLK